MELTEIVRLVLLLLLIVCAIAVNLSKNLMTSVIIFMSYSSIMCIIWILMESPDLGITEAAVGAGISGTLFLMTLKKIKAEDADEEKRKSSAELPDGTESVESESVETEDISHE